MPNIGWTGHCRLPTSGSELGASQWPLAVPLAHPSGHTWRLLKQRNTSTAVTHSGPSVRTAAAPFNRGCPLPQGLYAKMVDAFKKMGLEVVPGVGTPFDPEVGSQTPCSNAGSVLHQCHL